jgi:hypothetical protein
MMIGEVAELTSAKRGFPVTPPAAVSPAGSLLAKQAHPDSPGAPVFVPAVAPEKDRRGGTFVCERPTHGR